MCDHEKAGLQAQTAAHADLTFCLCYRPPACLLCAVIPRRGAVETCSEHPLAGAVLQFAAAHLAAPVASLDADFTAGLNQLEEPSEASQLLPSPTKAQRHSSPTVTATDWLQPATDVEVEEGEVDIACGLPYRLA